MKIAVLGATGLLGQALMRESAARGFAAMGIARSGTDIDVDVTCADALRTALDAIEPELVINAVADVNLARCEREPGAAYVVNAGVAATLADYCAANGTALLQISTDHYYTADGDRLHAEDAPVQLLNEYARTKYAGEAFALTHARSLVLRTNIVGFRGWRDRPTFVEWAIGALKAGDDMTLFDDFFTSSIDVPTFAAAALDLAQRGAQGVLNVAAREAASKAGFVLTLARELGLPTSRCRVVALPTLDNVRRAESLGLDVTRAENLLGYALPDTASVIRSLAAHYWNQTHEL